MQKTTIQVTQNTLDRLKSLKKYDRQSYNDLLNSLADDAEEESLSEEEITEIQQALEDVKNGRVYPIQKVAMDLGVKLK